MSFDTAHSVTSARTIVHHPGDETLAAFAAGALDAGRRLVVATHVSLCRSCRLSAQAFECVAGIFLDETDGVAMKPDAMARALEQLGAQDARSSPILVPGEHAMPRLLAIQPMGEWRWRGPGVYWRPVELPDAGDTRVFMLRVAGGTQLPHHKHTGFEWTCVLQGAFRHQLGRYGPGDFDEADEDVEHIPSVEAGEECVCLVAMNGTIQLQSWIGRLVQPFLRI